MIALCCKEQFFNVRYSDSVKKHREQQLKASAEFCDQCATPGITQGKKKRRKKRKKKHDILKISFEMSLK